MKLTWYGHSCFRFDSGSGSVVFDPYSKDSVPGLTLPDGILADAVVVSHGHKDHNAEGLITLTGSNSSDIQVETLAAYHDDCKGEKRGFNYVNTVMIDGWRVCHLGDIGCELTTGQIKALGRVDVLLIPVGGYYTIAAPAARELADRIGATVTVPMHYRGDGFGYAEVSTADEFISLSGAVERIEGSSLTLEKRGGDKRTVIFSAPEQK